VQFYATSFSDIGPLFTLMIRYCQLYLHWCIAYVQTSTWCRQHKDACL